MASEYYAPQAGEDRTEAPNAGPQLPPRPPSQQNTLQVPGTGSDAYPAPPQRLSLSLGEDAHSPTHYTRDPHKLVAYLIPFPKPSNLKSHANDFPDRFLIYTPPPPPLDKPAEGEKESKMRKVQRKWQEEVRAAKTNTDKVTSWKGIKSKATRGINTAMGWTTSSNLDFLNRVPGQQQGKEKDKSAGGMASASGKADAFEKGVEKEYGSDDDGVREEDAVKKTVGLEEMILVYPSSMPGNEEEIRAEFVQSMMRSKSKAQKDAVIATGLLPVSAAIDILATVIWPFGGLLEIDSVWLYSSFRGAKTARNVTKRLHSSSPHDGAHDEAKLKLSFTPSPRLDILRRYLLAACHSRDPWMFASDGRPAPTETEVLEAIGWSPSASGEETRNWEDEQWEIQEVKDDLRTTLGKGAREWGKWCKAFEKDPEKALKKG
jgi:hypothetical protein